MVTNGPEIFILIAIVAAIITVFPRPTLYFLGFFLLFTLILGMSVLVSSVSTMPS